MSGGAVGAGRPSGIPWRSARWALPLVAALLVGACEEADLTVPAADAVAEHYPTTRELEVEMSGNVAEITVFQPSDQLSRGGELWAKVGPYIYLFSDGTRDLFDQYGGLAGVRVITRAPGGREVARALLERDELNEIGWRRAINIAGHARVEGTQRVTRIEELVRWGEEHTTFEYDPRYVSGR